jgi:hypothetical protein
MRVICAVFVLLGGCEKWKEAKTFFQARPLDDKTALEVDTTPRLSASLKGSIEVDGKKVAAVSPHTEKPIPPGKHQVRVEAAGYISQEMEIDVKEGETTTLSLALKGLPTADGSPRPDGTHATSGKGKKKSGVEKEKEEADPDDKEPVAHSTRTFILTATPPQPAFLDGAALGTASGLRVQIVSASGELRVGDDTSGLVFSVGNKRTGLHLKLKNLGQRSVMVDGTPLTAKKGFDLDTRPRRVELHDVDGNKLVVLMKLID